MAERKWGRGAIRKDKPRSKQEAMRDEQAEIAEKHAQLKRDFYERDAIRFPKGWRLPS